MFLQGLMELLTWTSDIADTSFLTLLLDLDPRRSAIFALLKPTEAPTRSPMLA